MKRFRNRRGMGMHLGAVNGPDNFNQDLGALVPYLSYQTTEQYFICIIYMHIKRHITLATK